MADDEVASLAELRLSHLDAESFVPAPSEQGVRLPKATIVWNTFQRLAISLLPANELSYRLPSLICGILTSAVIFLLAARWRGLWFAAALAIVQHGSQPFILLAQLNRFYSMPLLLLVLTFAAISVPQGSVVRVLSVGALTTLTVLSHNITLAVFVLGFLAACPAYLLGSVSNRLLLRSGVAAAVSVLVYVLYLRPLVHGWNSTGNPTPVLVSYASHASIPALALAALGSVVAAIRYRDAERMMVWWALMFLGSLCVFQFSSIGWNPRYFLFFLPPVWMLAAYAMEFVGRRALSHTVAVAWYGCVAIFLLPGLLSHYQDGSRHDYRRAAEVVMQHHHPDELILSDDAETISYYLPTNQHSLLRVRTKEQEFPSSSFLLVCRSNAWTPLPQIPDRQMDLLAEIYKRRYDVFSHILRVYEVEPIERVTTKVNQ
jgi:hypothetical protein